MTIGANSYGTLAGVGALVPKWSGDGAFTATTRPASAQVEGWIDQVSGILNSMLSQQGFAIPVTQADVKLALTMFVQEEVADIVQGVNGSGRFGPTVKTKGNIGGRFSLVLEDVKAFVDGNAYGFEMLGATRTYSAAAGIGFRDTDESGDASDIPIFQREGFGASFTDWDV